MSQSNPDSEEEFASLSRADSFTLLSIEFMMFALVTQGNINADN
jgi:hypothetical protein